MADIIYLSRNDYINFVKDKEDGHWTDETIDDRWEYHFRAIELIKSSGVKDPRKVLEMGTMGISCVKSSDTIDFTERWHFEGRSPTYYHDARVTPWPINDTEYEFFVALRVFQHLVPNQSNAIKEAFRISKKVLLVVPEEYDNAIIPESKGISYKKFVSILEGVHPNIYLPTSFGSLFFWDNENPSFLNIEEVMSDVNLFSIKQSVGETIYKEVTIKSLLKKYFRKLK